MRISEWIQVGIAWVLSYTWRDGPPKQNHSCSAWVHNFSRTEQFTKRYRPIADVNRCKPLIAVQLIWPALCVMYLSTMCVWVMTHQFVTHNTPSYSIHHYIVVDSTNFTIDVAYETLCFVNGSHSHSHCFVLIADAYWKHLRPNRSILVSKFNF